MAINGIFTDIGLAKSIEAANNEGFFIFPQTFSVSETLGALDPTRTGPNAGEFFDAPISGRTVVDQNTIKVITTIPTGAIPPSTTKFIREVYLFAKDINNNDFLLAIGQPDVDVLYDPERQVTLEMEISLVNIDITGLFVFNFTQAQEVSDHNLDPNAHLEVIQEMNRAGQFLPAGGAPFTYAGQNFDKNANFDGAASTNIKEGVTFTATYNGPLGDSINLTFNGTDTVDTVRATWNAANPLNTVEHDGVGTEVLTAGSLVLAGGSLNVTDKKLVYHDVDGLYKHALADGTIKAKPVGTADTASRIVRIGNFLSNTLGFPTGSNIFLSDTVAGDITDIPTPVPVGIVVDTNYILIDIDRAVSQLIQNFDAIVTDVVGFNFFPTTQQAINAVATNSKILVDKKEDILTTLDTIGKTLNFTFNGISTGWRKAPAIAEVQKITFDAIPDGGTWRIEFDGQETIDLAFNASNIDVQNALNTLTNHNGVTVTGNFTLGFTIVFDNDFTNLAEVTFLDPGLNEIQRFDMSNIPDNGTITFEHESNVAGNLAFNDTTPQLEALLEALASILDVTVTGSFASQFFQMEFTTVDGLAPQTNITVNALSLALGATPTQVNSSTTPPISPTIIQNGKFPASNLKIGATPIVITVVELVEGSPLGPDTGIILDAPDNQFAGRGVIEDFSIGIDANTRIGTRVDMDFVNITTIPIKTSAKLAGVDNNFSGSTGFAIDINSQLKLSIDPDSTYKLLISGAIQNILDGAKLSQELNQLLLKFDGAVIDFRSGKIFESDGVTALGVDFIPPTITINQFRWFSINIVPSSITADNKINGQVLVLIGTADGTTKDNAPKAAFSSKPLGQIAIEGETGVAEVSTVDTVTDVAGSLNNTYFLFESRDVKYYAWYDVSGGGVDPSISGRTGVQIAIVTNDVANDVASATQAIIDALGDVGAGVSTNQVTITNSNAGSVIDTVDGASATGFSFATPLQGVNSIKALSQTNIEQLGVGAGSAGSSTILTANPGSGITGVIDGANDTFVLDFNPISKDHVTIYINGLQILDADWTLVTDTITFIAAAIPAVAQQMEIKYFPDPVDFITGP